MEEVQTITSHAKVSPGCCCAAAMLSLRSYTFICVSVCLQPVLQYSSAFDDEVEEFPEGSSVELPHGAEGVLQCVPEEIPALTSVDEGAPEAPPHQEGSARQVEPGHPPASTVHGPYYYFYQGE